MSIDFYVKLMVSYLSNLNHILKYLLEKLLLLLRSIEY